MSARICLITAGHPSTTPRMLKAADALSGAGYQVRIVSARLADWAVAADEALRRDPARRWAWTEVAPRGLGRVVAALRQRAAGRLVQLAGPRRLPLAVTAAAAARLHRELLAAALAEPADLYYGGTGAGATVAWRAARRTGARFAVDLEDFHPGEHDDTHAGRRARALTERNERATLPHAAFLTTSSAAIAEAYRAAYGVSTIVVHNVFSLPPEPPPARPARRLRVYWFSQTIGPGRGLEDAARALARIGPRAELHLRGRPLAGYAEGLRRLLGEVPLEVHPPAPPDDMTGLAREHDVGLGLEQPHPPHHALCLSNKIFTYLTAGLALVLTDTPAQRELARALGDAAVTVAPGDVDGLAAALEAFSADPDRLRRAQAASWEAARARFHFEHPSERGALLAAVAGALP